MKTISIINQKGGVGKSTTAHAIGTGLINKGYKVLFVDLDSQGNLSYSFGVTDAEQTAGSVINNPATIKESIIHTGQGDIIASDNSLALADTITGGSSERLKEALSYLKNTYDYVIIDTPPTLSLITINALACSNGVIIPAQADIFSLQGIGQLYNTIEAVKNALNKRLKVLGILLTRYNARATISKEINELMQATASQLKTKVFNTYIRECTAVKEAQAMQEDIYTYAPRCNAVKDYKALIEELTAEA